MKSHGKRKLADITGGDVESKASSKRLKLSQDPKASGGDLVSSTVGSGSKDVIANSKEKEN